MDKLDWTFWWRVRSLRRIGRAPFIWLRHRDVSGQDVILGEYPKSGRTWLTFMLAELLTGNEMDFESQGVVAPEIGQHRGAPKVFDGQGRLLRTHEKRQPCYGRSIYLVRHPADVAVSYYNWMIWVNWIDPTQVSFSRFFEDFVRGKVDAYGTWQDHVLSWVFSVEGPTLIMKYEDLRADPRAELFRAARFLHIKCSADAIERAVTNNDLESMRDKERRARGTLFSKRSDRYSFVRKGAVGGYEDWLNEAQTAALSRSAGEAMDLFDYDISATQ